MDEKKKNVTEEIKGEKDTISVETDMEIVDFDAVHGPSDKDSKEDKTENADKKAKEPSGENGKENIEKQPGTDGKKGQQESSGSDKKEEKEEKEKSSEDNKKEDKQESSGSDKKEEKEEKEKSSEDNKKEEKQESSDSEKKDEKEEKEKKEKSSEDNKKKEKQESSGSEKKDEKEEKEKKEKSSEDKKKEDKQEASGNSQKEEKPEEKKTENRAISQSKKLADVNAAKEKEGVPVPMPKKTSAKKVWGIVLGVLAGILLVAYVAGFVYFSGHFYQDVTVNGISTSGMNAEMAKQTLNRFYESYVLTIHTVSKGEDITIGAEDIAMQIRMRDEFGKCLKEQQPYLWFVNMFQPYQFHVAADTSWNEDMLEDFYESCDILNVKNMTKPADAYVGIVDGKFAVVEEVIGSTLSVEQFKKEVRNGLCEVMSEIDLMEKGCYTLPGVYSDNEDLKKDLEAKNEYADQEIKIQLDDLTLEPGMELYDEILKKSGDSYVIDDSKVKKYVENLAKQYDTLNTERVFETSFGNRAIMVLGESFGYEMDQEATLAALNKALKSGKSETVEAAFKSKGITLQGENDIGNSYIEVNLSEQKVYAYKNGKKIADGDCVSGNEALGHGTCTGLYVIQGKQSPSVLRGDKKPVTKTVTKKKNGKKVKVEKTTYEYDYESPVTFWMPFNGGIGLHDAAGWRSVYGGSIYRYDGSHGCVNLPYKLAQEIYNNFDVGTPVIVYFWDNENRQ